MPNALARFCFCALPCGRSFSTSFSTAARSVSDAVLRSFAAMSQKGSSALSSFRSAVTRGAATASVENSSRSDDPPPSTARPNSTGQPKKRANSRMSALRACANATRVGRMLRPASSRRARTMTASRQPTWDRASKLTGEMFKAASGLDVQLVYYRGDDECVALRWMSDAGSLVSVMAQVMCRSGHTQIGKVLTHTAEEHEVRPVNALIIISDACEELPADLYAKARDLGVPVFAFQEGDDASAAVVYAEIARLTGGAVARFDNAAAQRLADLLKAVAAYAAGGVKALALQKTEAAALLLTQVKR